MPRLPTGKAAELDELHEGGVAVGLGRPSQAFAEIEGLAAHAEQPGLRGQVTDHAFIRIEDPCRGERVCRVREVARLSHAPQLDWRGRARARVDENDQVARANLIVSTTHNNQAMNTAIREVARRYLDGRTITEGLLNHIEVAVRAFDPCLSCATHAIGRMPLAVELLDAEGALIDRRVRGSA